MNQRNVVVSLTALWTSLSAFYLSASADAPLPNENVTIDDSAINAIIEKPQQQNAPQIVPKLQDQLAKIPVSFTPGESKLANHKAIMCTVTNNTDHAVVVYGEKAVLVTPHTDARAASQAEIDTIGQPPTHGMRLIASSVGSVALAATTVGMYQTLKGRRKEHKPVLQRYEYDEERRINEAEAFGQRLLYPGESTTGKLYFAVGESLDNAWFLCPVAYFHEEANKAVVRVQFKLP
jgi:hypothetical protein